MNTVIKQNRGEALPSHTHIFRYTPITADEAGQMYSPDYPAGKEVMHCVLPECGRFNAGVSFIDRKNIKR